MQQVTTVEQAFAAVEHGADIIIAQGGEAGGYGGSIATLALVPQVVDAVRPTPVVAAGGIADGRGLAAALALGAAGVNLGTRFLACEESPVGEVWKKAIIASDSQSWVQLDFVNDIRPNPGTMGYGTRVRALRTEFTDRWQEHRDELRVDPTAALTEMATAATEGNLEELFIGGGQSAGLVGELLPVAEVVRMLVSQAEDALAEAGGLVT
jgi:nitronate monooxygenase/enoyl-[acyl-carrier protein] reductase II